MFRILLVLAVHFLRPCNRTCVYRALNWLVVDWSINIVGCFLVQCCSNVYLC